MRSLPGRGGGEIALGLAMLERAKRASHIESTSVTLRHHAEGMFPTAERTLDPARMFEESLTPRPELENDQDPFETSATSPGVRQLIAKFDSPADLTS